MLRPLIIVLLAIACTAATSATQTATTTESDLPQPSRSVVYKRIGDVELKLFIFKPLQMKPGAVYPAIVMFFGGGWKSGTPEQFYRQCAYLASRGMIAMSAEYRTANKHGTSPRECVMDGKSCVRWIRAHAKELQIDPARLAAGGGSAGGHVAAAAAMLTSYDPSGEDASVSYRPDALVLFNPVLDNGPQGYGYDRVQDYYKDISPCHNLRAGLPPMLLMLGTKDQYIPAATLQTFKTESEKLGNRCDLILYPNQSHGFFNYKTGDNPFYEKSLQDADAFLVSLGYLAKKQ